MLQDVTYADLKFGQSPPEGTRLEDLTYGNVQAPGRQEQNGGVIPKQEPRRLNRKPGAKRLPWLLAAGMAGFVLVLLAALIALGVHYGQLQKTSEEEKGQLDRAMEDLNQTRESKAQREEVLNATWAHVAKDWCPETWVLHQGKCLFFSTEERNWEQSQAACEDMSSRLFIARSWKPGQLQSLLEKRYYWIGLRKWTRQKNSWTWVDGSAYDGKDLSNYGDTCAYLNSGQLDSYYCTHAFGYICEKTKRDTQRAPLQGQWV